MDLYACRGILPRVFINRNLNTSIMKTSVNMIRKMGEFEVIQRTKDGMFNATGLLKQWNSRSGQRKGIDEFLRNKNTKEFIQTIEKEEDLNTRNVVLSRKGKSGGTWVHPYLFIDFAMWLNPSFKLQVIKFVYDQLIEYRHSAGDLYVGLSKAISRFNNVDYRQVAKGLNYIVFGKHTAGIRNEATQEQLQKLTDLEKNLAFSISMGTIETYSELIDLMRKMYHQIWTPKALAV